MPQSHLLSEILPSPSTLFNTFPCQILKDGPEMLVTLPAKEYRYSLATPSGHGRCTRGSLQIFPFRIWESIAIVERYTRSVRFEDSLKFYKAPLYQSKS